MTTPFQRDFRVMGCASFLVVHGGSADMLDIGEARLRELERLWSRFLETSDITRANRAAGTAVVVHEDTLAVVSRALDAWRQTKGSFDITTLPALVEAGYTHSSIDQSPAPALHAHRVCMSEWIEVDYDSSTLKVPAGSAIDLGGIGKGFAADIVAEDLVEAGATGVIVNIGGDLRVIGNPVDDTSWYLGIEDPHHVPDHLAVMRLHDGGVATSGTTIKRWTADDGTTSHHLIDPRTGRPSTSPILTATVIASDAATAEAFATSAMMLTGAQAAVMLDSVGLAGLMVDTDGTVHRTATMKDFEA
jgi:thiamine biosynthesis lipoprotein